MCPSCPFQGNWGVRDGVLAWPDLEGQGTCSHVRYMFPVIKPTSVSPGTGQQTITKATGNSELLPLQRSLSAAVDDLVASLLVSQATTLGMSPGQQLVSVGACNW